jgi:hypothetical protein
MGTATAKAANEAQIRVLIDNRVAAIRNAPADVVTACRQRLFFARDSAARKVSGFGQCFRCVAVKATAQLEFARYVMVFTTYEQGTAAQALQWYRMRGQIELVFKRLKSLLRLGHLPKYDARSSRAWLYGKLLIALLTQKLIRMGRDISPWGYALPEFAGQPLA